MQQPKLKVSYSLLNLYRRGQYQQAIDSYLHKELPMTEAMLDGIMWDQHITEWVDLYKKLPDEFGGDELKNPQTQVKIQVPYNELCDLVILTDILDGNILWENKTGNAKDSGDYAQDFQISMYFLGLELAGKKVDRAIINHYNQYKNELDRALVWKTPQEVSRAKNFIDTFSPEVFTYFSEHGILTLKET